MVELFIYTKESLCIDHVCTYLILVSDYQLQEEILQIDHTDKSGSRVIHYLGDH